MKRSIWCTEDFGFWLLTDDLIDEYDGIMEQIEAIKRGLALGDDLEKQLQAADELVNAARKQRAWSGDDSCAACTCTDCVELDDACASYERLRGLK